MKVIAMWRRSWLTFRTVLVSLLVLATLLVYVTPTHASLVPHSQLITPHEHAIVSTTGEIASAGHPDQLPCADAGFPDDGVCCDMAQCTTMHGGLIASAVEVVITNLAISTHLPALAIPEGIGSSPALRPPA